MLGVLAIIYVVVIVPVEYFLHPPTDVIVKHGSAPSRLLRFSSSNIFFQSGFLDRHLPRSSHDVLLLPGSSAICFSSSPSFSCFASGSCQRRSGFRFIEKSIRLHLGDIGVDSCAYSQLLSGRYLWLLELRNESRSRYSRQSSKGKRNISTILRSTLGLVQTDSNHDSRRCNYGRCEDLHGVSCESFLRTVTNVLISRERRKNVRFSARRSTPSRRTRRVHR